MEIFIIMYLEMALYQMGLKVKVIELTEKLYEIVHKYNGSFSAEHGLDN